MFGGLFQIVATKLLIMSFGYRNFAVGTAYSKTETVQSAILAFFVLHEHPRELAWIGMCIGLHGVMTLSLAGRGMQPRELLAATVQPAAVCGLGAGTVFAFTTVFIKLGNQSLIGPSLVVRALFTLVVTNVLQILMQGAYLYWANPRNYAKHLPPGAARCGSARCRAAARRAGSPASPSPRSPWCARSVRSRSCSRCCSAAST